MEAYLARTTSTDKLGITKKAVEDAGVKLGDVIRTRSILEDMPHWQESAKAHGEYFSDIRPACTFVEV